MTHTAPGPAPTQRHVALAALWFGLFAAPATWSIQEVVSYAIAAHSCYPGMIPRTTPTFRGMWTLELVIGIVALVVAIVAGLIAVRSWRATRPAHAPPKEGSQVETGAAAGAGRAGFMALAGMLLSAMFFIAIVFNVVGLFLVPHCG
jgi:hypothetical protein